MALASWFVVVLDDNRRSELEQLAASRTAPVGRVARARALLAASDGASNAAIARSLDRHVDTVRAWRNGSPPKGRPRWPSGPDRWAVPDSPSRTESK